MIDWMLRLYIHFRFRRRCCRYYFLCFISLLFCWFAAHKFHTDTVNAFAIHIQMPILGRTNIHKSFYIRNLYGFVMCVSFIFILFCFFFTFSSFCRISHPSGKFKSWLVLVYVVLNIAFHQSPLARQLTTTYFLTSFTQFFRRISPKL